MAEEREISAEEMRADCNRADLERLANGDRSAEETLMQRNAPLVNGIAHRFKGRGAEYEDLVQIGSIGMLKAIRSFDLSRGTAFSTYAVPLIIGEIRRFLRDDGIIKVSRTQKRLGAMLMREREKYIASFGCEPRIEVLSEILGVPTEEAVLALDAVSPVHSLSASLSGEEDFTLENVLPAAEDTLANLVEHIALEEVFETLPPLWKRILLLRYYRDYSQQQTADALGLTQVKISREEKKIFSHLRQSLA